MQRGRDVEVHHLVMFTFTTYQPHDPKAALVRRTRSFAAKPKPAAAVAAAPIEHRINFVKAAHRHGLRYGSSRLAAGTARALPAPQGCPQHRRQNGKAEKESDHDNTRSVSKPTPSRDCA